MNDMLAIVYGHVYFIEDNERFKLGGEDLEKLTFSKFSNLFTIFKILYFYYFKTPIFFQIFTTSNTLEVLSFRDPIPRDVEVRAS